MSRSTRVIVAEDDPDQAKRLQIMLEELEPAWEVVQTVKDWPTLLSSVEESIPHVVFLDIHMPGNHEKVKLEALKSLSYQPTVIVTTGDPTFALEAFEISVTDYLVKPITLSRLEQATAKAKRNVQKNFRAGVSAAAESDGRRRWLTASRGPDSVIVAPEDVIFLQAERKYTRLLTKDQEAVLRMGISDVEKLLDERVFVRIHRSTIVNVRHIRRREASRSPPSRWTMQARRSPASR